MNFKTLENYINLCKEVKVEPSWKGLKYFSSGKENALMLSDKIKELEVKQRRALDEVRKLDAIIKEDRKILKTEIYKNPIEVNYNNETIYFKYFFIKSRSRVKVLNNKKIIFIKKTLSRKEKQKELHMWLKKIRKGKEVF